MTAQEIRQAFLDFFASKGHTIVPSAPIVVKNDPTLMFTNAGMNQFKSIFLGEEPVKFPRVADTQRCLRVSGKHNDLEEVGIDSYHHTMFEMLGNWSFGDYFKKEAIAWSWELLTEIYKLDKSRLYVTYFEGDEKEGLAADTETLELWREFVADDHILPGNKKDNFWEMGETGPCGPCSEIHYDGRTDAERAQIDGATLVNGVDDSVMEIWNDVFMQFNRLKDGSLQPLPAKHVDTGMGFERLVRIMQGKTSNYDTDVFQPLIQFIAEKSGIVYGPHPALSKGEGSDLQASEAHALKVLSFGEDLVEAKTDVAMRVMADHIRAISFAIADGQLPSNNKAGYVIRRILRRAVRYSYQYLNFKEPFLNQLVPILAQQFVGVFTELVNQKDFVQKVVLEEEVAFLRTLDRGINKFEEFIQKEAQEIELIKNLANDSSSSLPTAFKDSKTTIIRGNFAFELSDTYGFPLDLTELMAREIGWTVDVEGYETALAQQKSRSRAATAIDTGDWILLKEDDTVEFVGYTETETIAHVVKYRKVKAKGKEQYQIVLDKTPFYAESGGQVGDTGELIFPDGEIVPVTDTKKENGLIVHFVDQLPEDIDDALTAMVDVDKRKATNNNHSATHLLHAALKEVLGSHVNQKGSLVNNEYLRFDFSHFSKVTDEEIARIEAIVNERIRENILVDIQELPKEEAIAMGANALFGEKYGDTVRVVTMDMKFSIELCGGTHVQSTGQIGFFKIIAESAVAAGVRRIEAITGVAVEQYFNEQGKLIQQLKELLKNPKNVAKSVEGLLDENSRLKKELEKSVYEKAAGLKQVLAAKAEAINGINFIAQQVDLPNADAIKNLAYSLKDIVPNLFLVLTAQIDGKPNITVMIEESLVKEKGLNAGNIIRELAKEVQGGGGGQPFYATAGGKDVSGLPRVLDKARSFIPA
ncbi:alanine--tRNA ligase [Mucilaginibacter paludis]|uniref:Alanine--tRNA ligase n=1 Tax=Mucilaginibacter paludis DSM 18603 TaxID=714943 RepID=H1Y9T1_9SPHI|nr:alanine--tRNA ligase [Mucilaginibacter paludis]EHQ31114.1 alanyl-tRNA synthetase [Mucilaginibacter paludis DSM 18603]